MSDKTEKQKAEAEQKAKAEAEQKAKAEAEQKAKAEAEQKAKQERGPRVADGYSLVCKAGVKVGGDRISPDCLHGGKATFNRLVQKKRIVK